MLEPALQRVAEELTCPICLDIAQLPVNFACFRGCGGRFAAGATCLRSALCLHCANDALQLGRPPAERFPAQGGAASCLICRTSTVDARSLTPESAYTLNYNVMAVMDALGMGGTCRRCEEDCGSQAALLQHYSRRCPAAVVRCRFRGCAAWHTRASAPSHEDTCPVGRCRCSQCGCWVDRPELLRHTVSTCRLRVVSCVLCGHTARLPDMLGHLRLHQSQLQAQGQGQGQGQAAVVSHGPQALSAAVTGRHGANRRAVMEQALALGTGGGSAAANAAAAASALASVLEGHLSHRQEAQATGAHRADGSGGGAAGGGASGSRGSVERGDTARASAGSSQLQQPVAAGGANLAFMLQPPQQQRQQQQQHLAPLSAVGVQQAPYAPFPSPGAAPALQASQGRTTLASALGLIAGTHSGAPDQQAPAGSDVQSQRPAARRGQIVAAEIQALPQQRQHPHSLPPPQQQLLQQQQPAQRPEQQRNGPLSTEEQLQQQLALLEQLLRRRRQAAAQRPQVQGATGGQETRLAPAGLSAVLTAASTTTSESSNGGQSPDRHEGRAPSHRDGGMPGQMAAALAVQLMRGRVGAVNVGLEAQADGAHPGIQGTAPVHARGSNSAPANGRWSGTQTSGTSSEAPDAVSTQVHAQDGETYSVSEPADLVAGAAVSLAALSSSAPTAPVSDSFGAEERGDDSSGSGGGGGRRGTDGGLLSLVPLPAALVQGSASAPGVRRGNRGGSDGHVTEFEERLRRRAAFWSSEPAPASASQPLPSIRAPLDAGGSDTGRRSSETVSGIRPSPAEDGVRAGPRAAQPGDLCRSGSGEEPGRVHLVAGALHPGSPPTVDQIPVRAPLSPTCIRRSFSDTELMYDVLEELVRASAGADERAAGRSSVSGC